MPKRKRALVVPEVAVPRQTVDPTYAARVLEKMEAKADRLARKARKQKGFRDRKPVKPA